MPQLAPSAILDLTLTDFWYSNQTKSFRVVCSIAPEHSRIQQVTLSKTRSKAICLTKFPISVLKGYSSPHYFLLSLCSHYCDTGRLSSCSVTRQVASRLLGYTDHCQPLGSRCSFTEKNFENVQQRSAHFSLPLSIIHNKSPISDIQASKYKH